VDFDSLDGTGWYYDPIESPSGSRDRVHIVLKITLEVNLFLCYGKYLLPF